MTRSSLSNATFNVDAHEAAIHEIHVLPDAEARKAVTAEAARLLAEAEAAAQKEAELEKAARKPPTIARLIADVRAQLALTTAEIEASLAQIEASLGLRDA